MVFSASSTTPLLGQSGDSAYYLKRTLAVGAIGLVLMRLMSVRGAQVMRPLTGLLLIVSFGLLRRGDAAGHRQLGERRAALDRRRTASRSSPPSSRSSR